MSTERKQALTARFGYAPEIHLSDSASFEVFESNFICGPVPVVVIPFPTAKAAKAFCKVANMTHEERVKLFRESLRTHIGFGVSDQCAERVLTALNFPQTK